MSENMNRHEAELNEAALENVSGGIDENFSEAMSKAASLCYWCCVAHPSKDECSNNHERDLIQYLLNHGINSVPVDKMCPYYK